MNKILYESRCKCNEEISITKKRKVITRSEGKALPYPKSTEILCKSFTINYDKPFSAIAKMILNSFQNKYIYYAIDDILYTLKSDLSERDQLLTILYSPVLSLQNNLSVNFFDIWIKDIYIKEEIKTKKLSDNRFYSSNRMNYLTITLFYKTRVPVKKQDSLW